MNDRINERLSELEDEHRFRIIYACESGSRAWGFASEDSDYDVRFVFVWPKERYLGISGVSDGFDLGVDEELIDLSGWDLRKSLRLFMKSNGALLEWLHGPIVYREDAELMARWRGLVADTFCPKSNAAHYGGLAKNIWMGIAEGSSTTAKKYLYALRAVLAAQFVIAHGKPAPVRFAELLDGVEIAPEIRTQIDAMVEEKAGGNESDGIARASALDEFLFTGIDETAALVDGLERRQRSSEPLDAFFLSTFS